MPDFLRDPLGDENTPFEEWFSPSSFLALYDGAYHLGTDYNWGSVGDDAGEEVYAIADGEVAFIAEDYGDHGDAVVVYHRMDSGFEFTAVYGHVDAGVGLGSIGYGDELGTLHDYAADHLHFAIAEGHTLGALRGYTDLETRDTRATGPDGVDYVDVMVDAETVRFFDPEQFLQVYLNPEELAPTEVPATSGLMLVNSSGGVYRTNVLDNEVELLADYPLTFTDIAIAPDSKVYANTFGNLYALDLETESSDQLFSFSHSANGLASDERGYLYVGYNNENTIDIFDPSDQSLVGQIDLPSGTASAGDIHIFGNRLYYTTTSRTVLTLDLETGDILNEASHGLGAAYGLHYADGQLFAYSDKDVFQMNAATGSVLEIATLDINGTVYGSATAPSVSVEGSEEDDVLVAYFEGMELNGYSGSDRLIGSSHSDVLAGGVGNDTLVGNEGNDLIEGGSGEDVLNAGAGEDTIYGWESIAPTAPSAGSEGTETSDLRDIVFAGEGDDSVDAGYGNDLVYGQDGNDTIAGGFGVDELQGQNGDDVITGSAFSDLVFGGAGNDFVNGGFGHDRINGGSGADRFFHQGVGGHGSDWVQDYSAADGDVLLWGGGAASANDFQINFAHTENAEGERAGEDDIEESFVIYKPTGQIIWALVDGSGQDEINIQIGGDTFDLLS